MKCLKVGFPGGHLTLGPHIRSLPLRFYSCASNRLIRAAFLDSIHTGCLCLSFWCFLRSASGRLLYFSFPDSIGHLPYMSSAGFPPSLPQSYSLTASRFHLSAFGSPYLPMLFWDYRFYQPPVPLTVEFALFFLVYLVGFEHIQEGRGKLLFRPLCLDRRSFNYI